LKFLGTDIIFHYLKNSRLTKNNSAILMRKGYKLHHFLSVNEERHRRTQ